MPINNVFQQSTNAGLIYLNGCNLARTGNKTLTVAAGQARDATNTFDIFVPSAITITGTVNGPNGLDTGTLQASKMYYVYLAYDVTLNLPACTFISLSSTAPVMPARYTSAVVIGVWATDGSTNFRDWVQYGDGIDRTYSYVTPAAFLTAGTQTGATPIDISAFVPNVLGMPISISYAFTPAAANRTASIGGVAAINGQVAAVAMNGIIDAFVGINGTTGVAQLFYAVSNADSPLTMSMLGFVY